LILPEQGAVAGRALGFGRSVAAIHRRRAVYQSWRHRPPLQVVDVGAAWFVDNVIYIAPDTGTACAGGGLTQRRQLVVRQPGRRVSSEMFPIMILALASREIASHRPQ
jgi:hypothetical protein